MEVRFCIAGVDDAFASGIGVRWRDAMAGSGSIAIASGAGGFCSCIHCWCSAFKAASCVSSSCILARLAMFRGFGFGALGGSGTSSYSYC